MLRLSCLGCLQIASEQAETAALRAQLASSQDQAAKERWQRLTLQAGLSVVQAQLISSQQQVAEAEKRRQAAELHLQQEVAASRKQVETLQGQLAEEQHIRCAGKLHLREHAATHQQEVARLGAEAAQLARKTTEAEQQLQGQLASLKEKVSQLTDGLVAARADAADARKQQLSFEDEQRRREAAHGQEVALLQGHLQEVMSAGILAAQQERHRSDQREAAALHKQQEQLRAAFEEELRRTQRSLEVAADTRLQRQAAEHQQQKDALKQQWHQTLAALEEERQQQEAAYKSHLAGTESKMTRLLGRAAQEQAAEVQQGADQRLQKQAAEHQQQLDAVMQHMKQHLAVLEDQRQRQQAAYKSHLAVALTKLTELLGHAAQEQVADVQQALSRSQAELQHQTQRADLYAFEAARQAALQREAAQPAVLTREGPGTQQALPLPLVCGDTEPVDVEMADADSSPIPSLPSGPQSHRQGWSGAVPSGPAGMPAAVLPHQGMLALATTLHAPEQQQHHDSMELDGAASLPAALTATQRRPSYLASRGAGIAPPGPCTGSQSAQPIESASGQPHQQSQLGAGSLQGQALVSPASTTPSNGLHAGAAGCSPAARAASGMTLPPSFVSLSAGDRFSGRVGYTGGPPAGQTGSRLRGASRQAQPSNDVLAAACSLASGSEPGQAPQGCTPSSPAVRPCAVVDFGSMQPLEPQSTAEPANSAPVQSIAAAPAGAGLAAGQRAGSQAAQAEPSFAPLSSGPLKHGSLSSQQGTTGRGGANAKAGLRAILRRLGSNSQPDSPGDVSRVSTAEGGSCDRHASWPAAQTGASSYALHAPAAPGTHTILGQP